MTDTLVTPVEDLQIAALKAGATPEDASLQGKLDAVEEVPPVDAPPAEEFQEDTIADQGQLQQQLAAEGPLNPRFASSDVSPGRFTEEVAPPVAKKGESVYAAFAQLAEDPAQVLLAAEQEIASTGISATVERIKREQGQLFREDLADILVSNPELSSVTEPTLKDIAIETVQATEDEGLEVQKEFIQDFDAIYYGTPVSSNAVVNALHSQAANFTDETLGNWGDIISLAVVPTQIFLSGVGKDILGERYIVAAGSMEIDLAKYILAGATEEEKVARATRVALSVIKHSGISAALDSDGEAGGFAGNDVVAALTLMGIEQALIVPGYFTSHWQEFLLNAAGIAELIPVLSGVVRTGSKVIQLQGMLKLRAHYAARVRAGSRTRTAVDDLGEAAPGVEAEIKAGMVQDAGAARAAGTSSEEVSLTLLPQEIREGGLLEGASASVVSRLEGTKSWMQQLLDLPANTKAYYSSEFAAAEKRIVEALQLNDVTPIAKPSLSSAARSGDTNEIAYKAVYGNDSDYPLTLEQAAGLAGHIQKSLADIGITTKPKILQKEQIFGTFNPTGSAGAKVTTPPTRGYYVEMDSNYTMAFGDLLTGDIASAKARWALDPRNMFDEQLSASISTAQERKFFMDHGIMRMAEPLSKLPFWSRRKVGNLLSQGDEAEEVYSDAELITKGLNTKERAGYFAGRMVNELAWAKGNQRATEQLNAAGYFREFTLEIDGVFSGGAIKAVDDTEVLTRTDAVYNPYLKSSVKVPDERAIEAMRREGLVLHKVRHNIDVGDAEYSYIALRAEDTAKLRDNVIPYRKGHIQRINDDPYFVKEFTTKSVNGKTSTVTRTLASAGTFGGANKRVKQLSAANKRKGTRYEAVLDRNLNPERTLLAEQQQVLDGGGNQLWYNQRGERLSRVGGGLSSVVDPILALDKTRAAISRHVTMDAAIDVAVQRHAVTYGKHQTGNTSIWKFDPQTGQQVYQGETAALRGSTDPVVLAARNEWKWIEGMRYHPNLLDKKWSSMMQRLDRLVGTGLVKVAPTEPFTASGRRLAFAVLLGTAPMRQLPLQALTGLHLAGIDPTAMTAAFKDAALMTQYLAVRGNKALEAGVIAQARLLGHTAEEFIEVAENFRKSGKAYAIDANVMIAEAGMGWSRGGTTLAGAVARKASNIIKSPALIGKKIGFDPGELLNQAMTYSFAIRRFTKENPGKAWNANQRSLDTVADNARNLGIDMTQANAFQYQRGVFANLTQFMAINHKMLLRVMPNTRDLRQSGGTVMSRNKQKAKLAGGLLLTYGAAGMGLGTTYMEMKAHFGWEMDADLDNLISGGIASYIVNASMDELTGSKDSRAMVSESISPASNIFLAAPEMLAGMFEEGNPFAFIAGPGNSALEKVVNAVNGVYTAMTNPVLDTSEKFMKVMDQATQDMGDFSRIYKAHITLGMLEKYDQLYSTNTKGDIIAPITKSELVFSMMGVQAASVWEFYDILRELPNERQVKEDAAIIVDQILRDVVSTKDEMEVHELVMAHSMGMHKGPYGLAVAKEVFAALPNRESYVDNIATMLNNQGMWSDTTDRDQVLNAVRTHSGLSAADKSKITNQLEAIFDEVDASAAALRTP